MVALRLLVAVAVASPAVAFNANRRQLHQDEPRDVVTFMQTDVVTVTDVVYTTVYQDNVDTTSMYVESYASVAQDNAAATTSRRKHRHSKPAAVATSADLQSAANTEAPAASTEAPAASTEAPAASTDAPAAPAAAPILPSLSGKRGLAYNDAGLLSRFGATNNWMYNWDSQAGGATGRVFFPMLWGDAPEHTNNWAANAQKAINSGSTHLLSFNEPDLASQANMSPEAAASGHVQHMNPFAGKANICTPAVTNSGSPGMGVDWLKKWVSACNNIGGCSYQCASMHWYDSCNNVDGFFSQIKSIHDATGVPVFITEFAPTGCSDAQINTFLTTVLPRLDALDYVGGYAYFMVSEGKLIQNGQLSALGVTYNTL